VTALSICLGGDIKSLNRQSDIQSLVNHDTQNPTAEVEIELFFNKSENLVVRTVFGREQGSQTWMVNGKAKSRQVRIIFLFFVFVRCSFYDSALRWLLDRRLYTVIRTYIPYCTYRTYRILVQT
jgi:hypothetical protein